MSVTSESVTIRALPRPVLSDHARIQVLIEEYRALYGLLAFRLGAVDRRVPVAGGTFGAVLGGFAALPSDAQIVALLTIPAALIWLFRTIVSHARSKEDVLRRIDEIERQVNQIANEELISFQSRHPSRGRSVSGRSGLSSVFAVLTLAACALAACGCMAIRHAGFSPAAGVAYAAYLAAMLAWLLHGAWRLRGYHYEKSPLAACPLFVSRGGKAPG